MGEKCFSVDFSSKILVATNQGSPEEARNKVGAAMLEQGPQRASLPGDSGSHRKDTGTTEDITQGKETRETPWLLSFSHLLVFYGFLPLIQSTHNSKGRGSLENGIAQKD